MDISKEIKSKKWIKIIERGEFSFFEAYIAALGFAKISSIISTRIDGVFWGKDNHIVKYEPVGDINNLKKRLKNKDVFSLMSRFSIYDEDFNSFLNDSPFDNLEKFCKMYVVGFTGEILGYRLGLYSKNKKALEVSSKLRGTNNAQHRVLVEFLPKLFKLISKKYKLKLDLVKFLLPKEIISGIFDVEEIKKRSEFYVITVFDGKTSLFVGSKAINLIAPILELEKENNNYSKIIHGTVAYRGIATGRVKIVNNKKDMEKVKKGDVLVSIMTRTDLVPAMKKAVAIVTDEGGMTCHAAIVSRELKKPCITGTKNATKTLKDGDIVEVDANNGIVNIVN
jgi:phosphoenolpyruvate synthase/pyruvate phosphate dikinase